MKKQYMKPSLTMVNVQIENLMLVVSGEISSGTADSRSGSDWDDEE